MPTLILASQSEARRRNLKRLGLSFEVSPAHIDEERIGRKFPNPRIRVRELARLKAQAVYSDNPNATVIGSDQMLVCDGKVYGKPGTPEGARRQLAKFSGRTIQLLTAVCLLGPDGESTFVHVTKMKFRKLTRREIADYVAADQPVECAGSFKFESYGIGLFEKVTTDDPTAIEGLPLLKLGALLRSRNSPKRKAGKKR